MSHQIPAKITRLLRIIERNPRRAMPYVCRLSTKSADASPQEMAWGRFCLGWTFLYWEKFDDARKHLNEALTSFQELGEAYGEARTLYGLALADVLQHGSSNGALDECARRFQALGSTNDFFRVQIYKAVEFNSIGSYTKASEWLEEHKDSPLEGGELDYARWLRVRASAAVGMGDLDDARQMLMESEAIFKRARYQVDLAKCRFELAWNELQHEDIQTAFELYSNAHVLFSKLDMPFRVAFCLKSLGMVQSRFGAYDIALSHTLRALEMFTEYQRRRDIAGCQLNLGNIYFHAGRWEEALYCYERAEQIYREADVSDELLSSIRNRAGVYEHLERFEEALVLLKKHHELTLDNNHRSERAEGLLLQAQILARISSEHSEEIFDLTERAYKIFGQNGNLAGVANSLRTQAELLLRLGRAEEAEALFNQALPNIQAHAHILWAVHHGLAESAVAQSRPQQALHSYREAAIRMASLRRRILSEEFSSSMYQQAETLYQDGILYASAQRDYETALLLSESQRALVLQRMLIDHEPIRSDLGSAYETLRSEMQELMDDQAIERNREATDRLIARYTELLVHSRHQNVLVQDQATEDFHFDLGELREELQQQYKQEWTCISYSFHGDRLLATIITPDELEQEPIAFDAGFQKLIDRLNDKKRRDLNYVNLPKLGKPTRWENLDELGARLLPSALIERLNPNHRLLIVPCEQIHGVLWSALRVRGAWLMQQAVIQVLPALSILPLLAQRRRWQQERKVLLLGCSDFGGRMAELPNVEHELKALQSYYGERAESIFPATRKEVLERASRGELQEYGTIHIASHGQIRTGRGLMAALMFSDDDLLLSELAALELDGALVTLSACEGATTDLLPGEEAFSLSRAFLVAGARAILASQLPVRDGIAMAFMQYFHASLDRLQDPALALMETQRHHVNTYGDQGFDLLGLPIGWGSFVLTGV
jgi:CHAT domain-containing protein